MKTERLIKASFIYLLSVISAIIFLCAAASVVAAECKPGTGPGACKAGTTRCFDPYSYQNCSDVSCQWDAIIPCSPGESCVDGKCANPSGAPVPKADPPRLTRPKNTKAKCGPGETLKGGICVPIQVCKPGSVEEQSCNPNDCPTAGVRTRTCSDAGGWLPWTACNGCGGAKCGAAGALAVCSEDCSWKRPLDCGSGKTCIDGACRKIRAQFEDREPVGDDFTVSHFPIKRKNGESIKNASDLARAYRDGDIVIFAGRREISVPQKPSTALDSFSSIQVRGWAEGQFISISEEACGRIGGSVLNKYVRAAKTGSRYRSYRGKVYRVVMDYVEGCSDCWGKGPCLALDAFDVIDQGKTDDRVKGWVWELYDHNIVFGTKAGPNEIAIDPESGRVTGMDGLRISYYH